MKTIVLTMGLVLAVSVAAQAQTWDILDETYGSEEGQISFVDAYPWPWTSTPPAEVLNDGYAALTHDAGIDYAARENGTVNLPTGDWRMDVKLKLDNALGFSFYLGDHDNVQNRALVQVNALYQETSAHPNTISDYNFRIPDGGEIQAAGFDGSALHVYSFRSNSSQIDMYLDDAFLTTLTAGTGVDVGYEAAQFGFGAAMSAGPGTSEIYYVKINSDPFVPPPPSLPGDANGDNVVNAADAAALAANWQTMGGAVWAQGDFNEDGNVDDLDATILAVNWQPAAATASVPEPSTVCLLIMGCIGLLQLGRRCH